MIGNGQDHFKLFIGYPIGAAVMVTGGAFEIGLGIRPRVNRWRTSRARYRPSGIPGSLRTLITPRIPALNQQDFDRAHASREARLIRGLQGSVDSK